MYRMYVILLSSYESKGFDLSNTNGSTWFFPVDGGNVEYGVSSVKFLPPAADKLHDEKITLVPCQPPNRKSKCHCRNNIWNEVL